VAPPTTRPAERWLTTTLLPTGGGASAAHQQIPLRLRVDLTVGAFQGRHHQRPATQALGVAHRRNGDVDLLPDPGEGRQIGSHHHSGDVLQLQRLSGRQGRTELRQHVDDALLGKGRLRRLVTATVETNDQAVTDQLVVAYPLH
jgi:hypothetical protein